MFFNIVLSTTSGLWSTGNTRKYHQINVYIYQCDYSYYVCRIYSNAPWSMCMNPDQIASMGVVTSLILVHIVCDSTWADKRVKMMIISMLKCDIFLFTHFLYIIDHQFSYNKCTYYVHKL